MATCPLSKLSVSNSNFFPRYYSLSSGNRDFREQLRGKERAEKQKEKKEEEATERNRTDPTHPDSGAKDPFLAAGSTFRTPDIPPETSPHVLASPHEALHPSTARILSAMSSACSSPCSSSGVSSASPPVPSASSGGVGGTSAVAVPGPKLEEDGACVRPHGEEDEPEPDAELDVVINNVVCSFSVRCHLNLRDIALRGLNVEYRKESGVSPGISTSHPSHAIHPPSLL